MNWLAHIFVSGDTVDYQLGNLLADPLKGKPWPGASEATRNGFAMHKVIDRFTDHHPAFINSKSRLGAQGFLRGVVIDMVYDHLLTRSWDQYACMDRAAFIEKFYAEALAAAADYPQQPRQFVQRIIGSDYLTSYADLDGLGRALERLDMRLSRKGRGKRQFVEYMPVIEARLTGLQQDFDDFFPTLLAHFKSISGVNRHPWIK